ncbi:Ribonuclease H-like domain containing protein [Trema orientale]|uniref:Ribonuclease H-like domain containing protein n=1 Tax=Trema orientale TaxID=63057 RepID=A0A2P5F182_TREOI|nr:Ribonuclease H-like domain containing protein [Trema orientale]
MEISVERAVPNEYDYFVRVGVGGDQRTIITTTARNDSDVKDWIPCVQKINCPKTSKSRHKLVPGLCADRSLNYANGRNGASREADGEGLRFPNAQVELRDLAAPTTSDKRARTTTKSGRFSLAKLARIVLGGGESFVKPNGLKFWDSVEDRLSDEMVKYATAEAFVTWRMGIKLLGTTNH